MGRGKQRRIRMKEGKTVTVERKRRECVRSGRNGDEKKRKGDGMVKTGEKEKENMD